MCMVQQTILMADGIDALVEVLNSIPTVNHAYYVTGLEQLFVVVEGSLNTEHAEGITETILKGEFTVNERKTADNPEHSTLAFDAVQ